MGAATWPLLASLLALALPLLVLHRPLGDHLARTYTAPGHLAPERAVYRLLGVDPDAGQSWRAYARSVLLLSLVGVLGLYALLRTQGMTPLIAVNTATSFVTNTNWQAYSGETLGDAGQALGLVVQNFLSAATGLAVAAALVRGVASRGPADGASPQATPTLGNFWVDLTRSITRVLLPLALLAALLLMTGGVVQTLRGDLTVTTVAGGTQVLPGGPVASQEAIKLLGTNGGGFFNANSAHPFENPSAWTNLVEILLILLIPVSLPRAFGRMTGDLRQGRAVLAAMALLGTLSVLALSAAELAGHGAAPEAAGAAMEGKETRFGVIGSAIFAAATTLTSTGAVNAMHDSFTALGGMVAMLNMLLGEIAPGGVGSGLYGMLLIAVLAAFVAGLLVGRTPEWLGKRIGRREMTLTGLALLVMPVLVLSTTAIGLAVPPLRRSIEEDSLSATGPHGLSELLYAVASAANNNGSAFAGLDASTPWMTLSLAAVMLLGRFVPIVLVLALAGSFAAQRPAPATAGTLPTHGPLFIGLMAGTAVLVTALVVVPVLALGPLAEGLS